MLMEEAVAARPRRLGVHFPLIIAAVWSALAGVMATVAEAEGTSDRSLADMSIEELMNVEVVSVSKKAQRLSDSAAAVYVISADDIHRSGATNIPELLRTVPGVEVAWIGGDAYSVTIRGFSGRFSNKLLVLRDGRSLYTNLFAGVFWERELPVMRDIERIEIIRGPGAAVWGANAVNGVINIITRSARETTDGFVQVGGGDHDHQFGEARYGWQLDEQDAMRVYARGAHEHPGSDLSGHDGLDSINNGSGGARFDRKTEKDSLSFQAEGYDAYSSQAIDLPAPDAPYSRPGSGGGQHFTGGFALGRYQHELDGAGSVDVQGSYEYSNLYFPGFGTDQHNLVNLQAQDHFLPDSWNDIVWGATFNSDSDRLTGSQFFTITPESQTRTTASLLAQDEIRLVPDHLRLQIGSIFEYDSIAGTHAMPDLRLAWNPSASSTVWVAASRALRAPSRAEQNIQYLLGPTIPAQPPYLPLSAIPVIVGTPTYGPEKEWAYQVGYRIQPQRDLSIDLTGFLSHYSDLRTNSQPGQPTPSFIFGAPYLQIPVQIINGLHATSEGFESSVDWRVLPRWRLEWVVSYVDVYSTPRQLDYEGLSTNAPKFTSSLRSSYDLGPFSLDAQLRRVGTLTLSGIQVVEVPAYTTLDLRGAWHVRKDLELALDARNLLKAHHLEYYSDNLITDPRQVDRTVYASITYTR